MMPWVGPEPSHALASRLTPFDTASMVPRARVAARAVPPEIGPIASSAMAEAAETTRRRVRRGARTPLPGRRAGGCVARGASRSTERASRLCLSSTDLDDTGLARPAEESRNP